MLGRGCIAASLVAVLTSCAPAAASRAPSSPTAAPPTPFPPVVDAVPPPRAPAGPVVIIGVDDIRLDGKPLASVAELDHATGLKKVDALFDELKARREAYKKDNPGLTFLGVASIVASPTTSGQVFASTYQTIAFAGYRLIHVAALRRYLPTLAQVPGPPCGTAEAPCPMGRPRYVLHARGDQRGWKVRVPREDGPIDRGQDASVASVDGFRSALDELLAPNTVGVIVFHVEREARFDAMAPFLEAAVTSQAGIEQSPGLFIGIRRFDTIEPTANAKPIGPDATSGVTGRLPPELIQRVVRESFDHIRKCYELALARDRNAAGKVETKFVIERDGKVSSATTTVTGALPPDVGSCITKVFETLVFEPPEGGIVTVVYPISLSPSSK